MTSDTLTSFRTCAEILPAKPKTCNGGKQTKIKMDKDKKNKKSPKTLDFRNAFNTEDKTHLLQNYCRRYLPKAVVHQIRCDSWVKWIVVLSYVKCLEDMTTTERVKERPNRGVFHSSAKLNNSSIFRLTHQYDGRRFQRYPWIDAWKNVELQNSSIVSCRWVYGWIGINVEKWFFFIFNTKAHIKSYRNSHNSFVFFFVRLVQNVRYDSYFLFFLSTGFHFVFLL